MTAGRIKWWRAPLLVHTSLALGCYGTLTQEPLPVVDQGLLQGFSRSQLFDGQIQALLPVANNGLLVQAGEREAAAGDGGLFLLVPGNTEPDRLVPPPGGILQAVSFAGESLVLSTAGLYLLDPKTKTFEEARFAGVASEVHGLWSGGSATTPALWSIGGEDRVSVFSAGAHSSARLPGVRLRGAVLAPTARQRPEAWLFANGRLFHLQAEGRLTATLTRSFASPVTHMVVDRGGSLWLKSGASLLQRSTIGSWVEWLTPSALHSVVGHPRAATMWLVLEDRVLHYRAGQFYRVEDAVVSRSGVGKLPIAASDGFGSFYWASGEESGQAGLTALKAPRTVAFLDPMFAVGEAPPRLAALRRVSLDVPFAGLVEEVNASWGGVSQRTTVSPAAVVLNPWQLAAAAGEAELVVEVVYSDGAPPLHGSRQAIRAPSELEPPRWSTDLSPLSAARCGQCHGQSASARVLLNRDQWREQFTPENSLRVLESGTMPIGGPPLSAWELSVVEAWRLADFPE